MTFQRLPSTIIELLAEQGWCMFRDRGLADDILKTASLLGDPICHPEKSLVAVLKPQDRAIARPNSTSALYGRDAFPIHTDMAHWPLPPRYIVMRSSLVVAGFPTVLIDSCGLQLNAVVRENWARASWMVSRVRQPFLCSMFFDYKGKRGIRWDVCTMSPYGELANTIAADISLAFRNLVDSSPIAIEWQSSEDILIIDNWRILHMRPAINETAKYRTLERVLVKEASVD